MRTPPTRSRRRTPRWSLRRTLGTTMLVVLAVLWLVALLRPAGWGFPWWQALLLGALVGAPVGWYGGQRRPAQEP